MATFWASFTVGGNGPALTAHGSLDLNPFTAEVAIMRLLGSVPKSHLCDQRRRSKVTSLSDLMTLFIDLGCLYCKQTQRAFIVLQNTLNWWKIDSVDQKFNWLECGNFSQDAGTPGTERVIGFSQLAVKGLNKKFKFKSIVLTHLYVMYLICIFQANQLTQTWLNKWHEAHTLMQVNYFFKILVLASSPPPHFQPLPPSLHINCNLFV
jgi:hypothetical protein